MHIKNFFVEELHVPNRATFRAQFLPVAIFAIFCLLIPFRIDNQTDSHILYFSKRIFVGIMSFSFFLRFEEFFLDINQKKDLDKITTIITWIVFVPTVVIVGATSVVILLIFSLVFKRLVYSVMIIISSTILFIFGAKPKFVNSFPKVGQCILVANHCSGTDDLFLPLIFWFRKWKVVFASEVVRIPLVHVFAERFVGIPVDRTNSKSRIKALMQTKRAIQKGFDIMIYPEGRRLRTSEYNNGKVMENFVDSGAFDLSIKNNLPIVPVVISWTFLFKPRSGQWWHSPRTIKIIYLDPVYPEGKSIDELKEQVHKVMLSKLRETLQ